MKINVNYYDGKITEKSKWLSSKFKPELNFKLHKIRKSTQSSEFRTKVRTEIHKFVANVGKLAEQISKVGPWTMGTPPPPNVLGICVSVGNII